MGEIHQTGKVRLVNLKNCTCSPGGKRDNDVAVLELNCANAVPVRNWSGTNAQSGGK